MNDKLSERIKAAFSDTAPSDELTEKLLHPERPKAVKKIKCIRTAAIAAAACLTLGMGAYAANYISFDEVFGDYVKVSDKELADSLMGTVSDFRYKVSDDDYAIRILGVSGNSYDMMLDAEIYRVDGTPVKEHFLNIGSNNNLQMYRSSWDISSPSDFSSTGGGTDFTFNDDGNVLLHYQIDFSDNIRGKKLTFSGSDIYSLSLMYDFVCQFENGVGWDDEHRNYTNLKTNETYEFDDSGIIGLPLEWSFSMKFTPSEAADIAKTCSEPDKDFPFVLYAETLTAHPTAMEFTNVGGKLDYTFVSENDARPADIPTLPNELYLIRPDGTRVTVHCHGGGGYYENDIHYVSAELIYEETVNDMPEQNYINISEFTAFEINGVVYELE